MTAPELMTVHPTDETLAAFIDDRLNTNDRGAVMEHLADCDECRTSLNDITDLLAMDAADNVVPMPKRRGWLVAAASVAVAAGLVAVFAGPVRDSVWGPPMEQVESAGAAVTERPTKALLSLDLPYREPKPTLRSRTEEVDLSTAPPEILSVLRKLYQAKRPDPHAFGVTLFLAGDFEGAIPYLEKAAETDAEAKVDLAAALLARGRGEDYQRALDLSKESDTPQALWNRAVAYENLQRYDEAVQAWNAYLKADPSSPWAAEAREDLQELQALAGTTRQP